MALSGILASLLLLASSAADSTSVTPSDDEPPRPEIRIVKMDGEVRGGEPLTVDVLLDSHGQPPSRLGFATGCQFDWTLVAADGPLARRNMMCLQALTSIQLDGKGRHEQRLLIPTDRTAEEGWPFEGDVLPVGEYELELTVIGYVDHFGTAVGAFRVVR